jgi:PQQ-dependent catabolism-associated CXXCW motif protein
MRLHVAATLAVAALEIAASSMPGARAALRPQASPTVAVGVALAAGTVAGQPASAAKEAPPPEPTGYWTGPINSPVPTTLTGGHVISDARRLQALLEHPHTVVIDVSNAPRRPDNMAPGAPWLPLPHQAIPGSLWIPGAGLGEIPPALDRYFREQLASATQNDLARPLVIYCHQSCWLSWNAAKRAISYGYSHVHWYRDGIEGWKAARLPTAVIEPRVAPEG